MSLPTHANLHGSSSLQLQDSPDVDPLSDCDRKGQSQNAWLWSDHTLSDVTVVLQSHEQLQHPSRSSADQEDTGSLDRPLKKVCKHSMLCSCADRMQPAAPGAPALRRNSSDSVEQHSSVFETGISTVPLPPPWVPPAFQLHAVILSSASGYFRALFARSKTCAMGGWCPECKVTTQVLEGHELEAAEHVLRFIYTVKLPTNGGLVCDGLLLLWMIQVADRWDVPTCIQACKDALFALSDSVFPTSTIFTLPATFCSNTAVTALVAEAEVRLLNVFGDALSVMRDPDLLAQLTQLPGAAMLALLKSDSLTTDAEATVLLLLVSWYRSNSPACSNEEFTLLREGVRYSRMTRAYLCGMLQFFPEFCLTLAEANELWMVSAARIDHTLRGFEIVKRGVCPEGWFRPTRPVKGGGARCLTLQLKIPLAQLLLHAASVALMRGGGDPPEPIQSQRVFAFGYDWELVYSSRQSDEELFLATHVIPPLGLDVRSMVECSIETSSSKHTNTRSVIFSRHSGEFNILGNVDAVLGGDVSMEPWAEFIEDGHLSFSAVVTMSTK